MTTNHCTASSVDLENTTYPTLITNTVPQRIAEDTGEYTTTASTDAALAQALKRLELKATGKALARTDHPPVWPGQPATARRTTERPHRRRFETIGYRTGTGYRDY